MSFNSKDHYNVGEIRPRFKLVSDLTPDEIYTNVERHVENDETVTGRKVYDQFYLDIPLQERHIWSPELRVSVELDHEDHENRTLIRVLVGPQGKVWMGFVITYIFLLGFSFFGALYGIAEYRLGNNSPWLWSALAGVILFISIYVFAKVGQRSTRNSTLHLVSTLLHGIGFEHFERVEE